MQKIQSLLRMSNEEKKSNVALSMCLIRPKTSKRKISNNIEEMRFYHEIHNYQVKQKLLLETIKKMIKSYNKCIEMSKQSSQPKSNYFEDIKLVVSHFVINYLCLIKYTIPSREHETVSLNSYICSKMFLF